MEILKPLLDNQVVTVVLAAIFILIYKIIERRIKNNKDLVDSERLTFENTLKGLSSSSEYERITSAILLRRFLPTSFGLEAMNVISSILRISACGEFQKTLADSISHTKNVLCKDFQYSNFQNAYIKLRVQAKDMHTSIIMNNVDFFMADFSYASLNNVVANGAIFYKANLSNTRFTECSLVNANFQGTDLKLTKFKNCQLNGATFCDAINIPDYIYGHLNEDGTYCDDIVGGNNYKSKSTKKVFFSCLGNLTPKQLEYMCIISERLKDRQICVDRYTREEYRHTGQLAEICRRIDESDGVIVFGFKHVHINDGVFRPGSSEKKILKDEWQISPWNHIEAGIAIAKSKPLLLITDKSITGGLSDDSISDMQIDILDIVKSELESKTRLDEWLKKVDSSKVDVVEDQSSAQKAG